MSYRARRLAGAGSFDFRDGLAVLRKREDVTEVLRAVVQHENNLTLADGSQVADARAVLTVCVHPLELGVDVSLGDAEGRVGPLHQVRGVGRAEGARVLGHPRRSSAAALMAQVRNLAAPLRQLFPVGKEIAHRVLERTWSARTSEQNESQDGGDENLHGPARRWAH